MNLRKFGLITLIASIGTAVFGASIDHIQNYTAEYNANMAQQGAISATTSVYYNPAGLMRLKNGTYFTGGVQLAIGEETMKYDTKHDGNSHNYDADLFAPIPNFALFKKNDDRAYFWTFGGIAGGGNLEYKDGVAGITVLEDAIQNTPLKQMGNTVIMGSNARDNGSWAEGENMYAQTTLGMAWNVNSKLSLSAAGRLVYGWRNLKAHLDAEADINIVNNKQVVANYKNQHITADIDSERTAWGFGGQFGLNYAYDDTWNFAMRYDTKIKMEFEADATSRKANILGQPTDLGFEMFFPQYADGTKFRRDLPAILALGVSQKVTDKWTMFYGANYYFNESAKIDKDVVYTNIIDQNEKITGMEYDNGWELSLGTEYWLNEKWAVLGGVNYAKTGAKAGSYSDVEFAIDSFLVGMGVKYRPDEDTEFFPQYADGTKFRRDLPAILALGVSQKVTDKWTMFYGANYYFNESAKIDKDVVYTNIIDQNEKITGMEYDNGWELSLGTEYWLNEKWAVLGGVNYAKTGAKAGSYSDVEFAIDSFLVGMGVKYRPDEDTEWVVSTSHYFYESTDGKFSEKYHGLANDQRYDKNISSIGFSYTKKF